jgi:hypothetical protein
MTMFNYEERNFQLNKWVEPIPNYTGENSVQVVAATRGNFATLAPVLGDFNDIFSIDLTEDILRLAVVCDNMWIGILGLAPARTNNFDRDVKIGWHDCQRAERLGLIATLHKFMPRPQGPGQPDWAAISMKAAMDMLPEYWNAAFGYCPVLVESSIAPRAGEKRCFSKNGWINITDKNPQHSPTRWLKELTPNAVELLGKKRMEGYEAFDDGELTFGLLPIPDSLLESLVTALQTIPDPRQSNRQYPIGAILAITLIALICGFDNFRKIQRFGRRLTLNQATLLGLPYRKKEDLVLEPGYFVYYRLRGYIDTMKVAEVFLDWIEAHIDELPQVFTPGGDIVSDTIITLQTLFKTPPRAWPDKKWQNREPPGRIDPSTLAFLKKTQRGNS